MAEAAGREEHRWWLGPKIIESQRGHKTSSSDGCVSQQLMPRRSNSMLIHLCMLPCRCCTTALVRPYSRDIARMPELTSIYMTSGLDVPLESKDWGWLGSEQDVAHLGGENSWMVYSIPHLLNIL